MVKIIISNLQLAFVYQSLEVSLSFVSDAVNQIRVHSHILLSQLSSKRKGKKYFNWEEMRTANSAPEQHTWMCPYVHFWMRWSIKSVNTVGKVNCPYDFIGWRLCVLQMLKVKANMILHGCWLSYLCLRVPPLKVKMVPLILMLYSWLLLYLLIFHRIFTFLSKHLIKIWWEK